MTGSGGPVSVPTPGSDVSLDISCDISEGEASPDVSPNIVSDIVSDGVSEAVASSDGIVSGEFSTTGGTFMDDSSTGLSEGVSSVDDSSICPKSGLNNDGDSVWVFSEILAAASWKT